MSKLSIEQEIITGFRSNICSCCGKRIMREEDQAKGLCRECNPFSLEVSLTPIAEGDWREK